MEKLVDMLCIQCKLDPDYVKYNHFCLKKNTTIFYIL